MGSLLVSAVILVVALATMGGWLRWTRARRRARSGSLPDGVAVVRVDRALPSRIWVERDVAGGPQTDGVNRGAVDLILADGLLVVASHVGRVLEVRPDRPATATCTGPRRLVLEGSHPSGITRTRVEVVVDDAEGWATAIRAIGG